MLRFEREVLDTHLINEMLKHFNYVCVGINDEDGYPYVVPLNFGYEIKDEKLFIYTHMAKRGKKLELLRKNPKVCATFSMFNDFPDKKYKGHYHDYRSVITKGYMRLIDGNDDYETFNHGYELLYTCNNREIKPLKDRKVIPPIYIGIIECDLNQVTAKSEFPIRTIEDVPFVNVYLKEEDEKPFDINDIIKERRQK